ncbi:MAG: GNAT family N-acetyltransferase [Phaeovulum sp.]|uniref:GNAT family N-acetyltransferase n=1 Tax=Phaeovulum sp. TaxID=2934796 RepID=UPI002731EFBD|nr:GNAT family N-acetyltransferase [Phaeovulum sp.]MDP2064142.1 GNAT family N-acetyltransferase [Phaeovulum sp.]MDP3862665.1 GNAT family N-acetyltransferase [Phaeovulum sp.]
MTALSVHIPVLETERLVLRANRFEDFEPYAAFYQTGRAALRGGLRDRWNAWRSFCAESGHWVIRGYGFFAVEEKATGSYVGQVGPYFPDGWPEPEIGWMVIAGFEGKGYAHEAAVAARDFAFAKLGWRTAISVIHPQNERSQSLARRMGARLEGTAEVLGSAAQVWHHPVPPGAPA